MELTRSRERSIMKLLFHLKIKEVFDSHYEEQQFFITRDSLNVFF